MCNSCCCFFCCCGDENAEKDPRHFKSLNSDGSSPQNGQTQSRSIIQKPTSSVPDRGRSGSESIADNSGTTAPATHTPPINAGTSVELRLANPLVAAVTTGGSVSAIFSGGIVPRQHSNNKASDKSSLDGDRDERPDDLNSIGSRTSIESVAMPVSPKPNSPRQLANGGTAAATTITTIPTVTTATATPAFNKS